MATRTSIETSEDFRLLTAEIADHEGLPWHAAQARAREEWHEVGSVDADTPAGRPTVDWRFVSWLLLLALIIVSSALAGFMWLLVS